MKPRVHNVDEAAHLLMKERGYVVVGLLETALGFCAGDTIGKFGEYWLASCDLMLVKRTNRKDWGDQITLLGLREINGKTKAEYWQCKTVAIPRSESQFAQANGVREATGGIPWGG